MAWTFPRGLLLLRGESHLLPHVLSHILQLGALCPELFLYPIWRRRILQTASLPSAIPTLHMSCFRLFRHKNASSFIMGKWGPCRLYTQGRRIALSREEDTAALSRFIATDLPMQHKSRIPHKMCGGRLYRCIYYILSNGSINSFPAKKSRKCSNGI